MAYGKSYKTAICTCPADSRLVFLGHEPGCPERAPERISQAELDRELAEFREDVATLRALAPEPPQEIKVYLCFNCEKIHLRVLEIRRCYQRWVHLYTDYAVIRYQLAADEIPE